MPVIFTHPVTTRRAAFWRVCNLLMEVGLLLGNHMGDEYVMRDLMVMMSLFLLAPVGATQAEG